LKIALLQPIAAEQIREFWPWVRDGLEQLRARFHEHWIPEDVYASLRGGHSFLFIIGDELGFIIFQRHMDADGPVLFVWIIHGDLVAVHLKVCDEIEAMAREMKARRIRMQSPRKGWAKIDFFTAVQTVYEHELI
jgi:hypothetical protein